MAITYIVGNPGSGKTYFAVNQIYEYFVLPTLPNKRILGFEIKRKLK
ncbi:zonula occludens toxin, partial [Campylobacter jejuni]|nr:zonula occludens toxin [Campylobacter jejuni]EJD9655227.1 zonula occludens toxin [Campylobacter jejuni]EJT2989999.1 zonula occludens toxin [Campylobacter jejuni]EJY1916739.1 zonula occludens toxin [Campylobacter jejuni]EJZ3102745.1 zonula occludens toxin [Campylobacter jejuni]